MRFFRIQFLVLLTVVLPGRAAQAGVDLIDGDRVVFMGSAFFERDVEHNYLETLLTIRHPRCNVTFRNVGWSGDTLGAAGNDQLIEYVKSLKPTVLFLAFGMNESLEADASVEEFAKRYNKLIDGLKPTGARMLLLSPIVREDVGRHARDPEEHNRQLKVYSEAVLKLANERHGFYLNLFTRIERFKEKLHEPLTNDGIHLNAFGYCLTARMIEQELGFVDTNWGIDLDASGQGAVKNSLGVKVQEAKVSGRGIEFIATSSFLPPPSVPDVMRVISGGKYGRLKTDPVVALSAIAPNKKFLFVSGLEKGVRYSLKGDGQAMTTPQTGEDWNEGQVLVRAADLDQADQLRKSITEKNQRFFEAHGPQSKDKGRFTGEMPHIDEFIAKKEAEIAKLRVPVMHKYVLEQVN